MGMGTLNKVVLHFSSVFWEPVDFFGHAGKDRRKWLLFMDMSRVTNRPILVAMSGGPFAVFVERLGDAEIVRRAMAVIRTIHTGAPDPTASQVTRWKADRFSRGSFSFIPPGCRSGDTYRQEQRALQCGRKCCVIQAPCSVFFFRGVPHASTRTLPFTFCSYLAPPV